MLVVQMLAFQGWMNSNFFPQMDSKCLKCAQNKHEPTMREVRVNCQITVMVDYLGPVHFVFISVQLWLAEVLGKLGKFTTNSSSVGASEKLKCRIQVKKIMYVFEHNQIIIRSIYKNIKKSSRQPNCFMNI